MGAISIFQELIILVNKATTIIKQMKKPKKAGISLCTSKKTASM